MNINLYEEKMKKKIRTWINLFKTIGFILKNKIWKKNDYVLLMGTEDFGNLGDHQIAESEMEFITHYLGEYRIVEVPASEFYNLEWKIVERYIDKNNYIFITGGGNWGDDYLFSHNIKRTIIREFPNNPKIVFPVTINYTNSEKGKDLLKKDQILLKDERKILLAVRDEKSYEIAKEFFPETRSYLMPDIVMFSNKEEKKRVRDGCIICIRNDKESVLAQEVKSKIIEEVKKNFNNITQFDTQYEYSISVKRRKRELEKVFYTFKGAKLVITDRLHGMIFSFITATPFIAFDNRNNKNRGAWKWISNIQGSYLVNSVEEFENLMLNIDEFECRSICKNIELNKYYDWFYQLILECSEEKKQEDGHRE